MIEVAASERSSRTHLAPIDFVSVNEMLEILDVLPLKLEVGEALSGTSLSYLKRRGRSKAQPDHQ